ncbi:transmembrane protein, putative [Medicago truncatula]|uniref:Transmembrane protein, putative n=1 Tax=Medicago truncatula TaxID=3880 RepID=G7I5P6_MEDTR|nr:transmembrane protein, putative [Medicago truncatula]
MNWVKGSPHLIQNVEFSFIPIGMLNLECFILLLGITNVDIPLDASVETFSPIVLTDTEIAPQRKVHRISHPQTS